MQAQFQLSSYIPACTNETHSTANLQDIANPYFGWFALPIIIAAKVVIKCCRFARECVSFVHRCNYPAGILFASTDTNTVLATPVQCWA